MYHIKDDKRAQTSAELLCGAMLRLLERLPLEDITITMLQQESTVSRTTFYRAFDEPADILALLCDRGFAAVFRGWRAQPPEARGSIGTAVFRYWAEHSAVLEALIRARRQDVIFDSLRRSAVSLGRLRALAGDDAQYDYFVSILTSVMTGILVVWIEHGKAESGEQVLQTVLNAFAAYFELEIV